jgi:nitroreductase
MLTLCSYNGLVPVLENTTVISTLLSRASVKLLGEPGPDDAELRVIFEAAVRAPDHGKLRPWRFFVVRGDARRKLSDLFVAGVKRREPGANEAQIEKEREKPLRAPVTIAVVAKIVAGHKIPEIEQTLSAGAAAMNILNAIHALGFAAKWVTGANCYDAEFRRAFGLDAADQLIGFIHAGTPVEKLASPGRPDPDEFMVEWAGDVGAREKDSAANIGSTGKVLLPAG